MFDHSAWWAAPIARRVAPCGVPYHWEVVNVLNRAAYCVDRVSLDGFGLSSQELHDTLGPSELDTMAYL